MPPKRVQVTPPAENTLAILCCDPSSQPIASALEAYARAIEDATARVAVRLRREEWNYLADCLNGCWHVQELSGLSARTVLRAEAEDAHRLNRLGEKWFGMVYAGTGKNSQPVPASQQEIDYAVSFLLESLAAIQEIEAQAILLAVRHFWAHPKIDHTTEEWWTIRHRISPRAR